MAHHDVELKIDKDLEPAVNHPLVIEGTWLISGIERWIGEDLLHSFVPLGF